MAARALAAALALSACATSAPQSVVGGWRIEDVNGAGVIDASRLEVTFAEDGAVSGHAGCNRFNGRYTHHGSAFAIGRLAVTRRACAEALMVQESRVLAALESVSSAALTGEGALVLTGSTPARLLLRRMDEGGASTRPFTNGGGAP